MQNNDKPDIYNYEDAQEYLCDTFSYKKSKQPSYSIHAWSEKMGFKHPSSLQFLLNGRRNIRTSHIKKIINGLDLSINEEDYFEEMVHFNESTDSELKEKLKRSMERIKSMDRSNEWEHTNFKIISDWYHFAIAALILRGDFKNDPAWIVTELNNRVTKFDVIRAIKRLKQVGVVLEKDDRLFINPKTPNFYTSKEWQCEAVLRNQVDGLDIAKQTILDKKNAFTMSTYMTIQKSKIQTAHSILRELRAKLVEHVETEGGDATYQLSVQFFDINEDK